MAKGKCIECGDGFRGRTDKKFCSDNCRSQYNNRRYKSNETMVKINQILKHNYRILKKLRESLNKRTIPIEYLLMEGFVMDYFTHMKSHDDKRVKYCYDYGIADLENGFVKIHEEIKIL